MYRWQKLEGKDCERRRGEWGVGGRVPFLWSGWVERGPEGEGHRVSEGGRDQEEEEEE
jgi:hypothetical protein